MLRGHGCISLSPVGRNLQRRIDGSTFPRRGDHLVFIVDDHGLCAVACDLYATRSTTSMWLGEAADGVVALDLLKLIEPPTQVLVLDLQMPRASGMAVIQQIRELYPADRDSCTHRLRSTLKMRVLPIPWR